MNLRRSALLAAVGIGVAIVIRTVGTLAPGLFRTSPPAAGLAALLLAAASLFLVLFFAAFYATRSRGNRMITPASLAALGAGAVFLLHLKGLFAVLGLHPPLLTSWPPLLEAGVPWAASFFTLVFFVLWPKEGAGAEGWERKKYVLPALFGAAVLLAVRTLILANFFLRPGALWFSDLPRGLGAALVPVTVAGSGLILWFLLWMYRSGGAADPRTGAGAA